MCEVLHCKQPTVAWGSGLAGEVPTLQASGSTASIKKPRCLHECLMIMLCHCGQEGILGPHWANQSRQLVSSEFNKETLSSKDKEEHSGGRDKWISVSLRSAWSTSAFQDSQGYTGKPCLEKHDPPIKVRWRVIMGSGGYPLFAWTHASMNMCTCTPHTHTHVCTHYSHGN